MPTQRQTLLAAIRDDPDHPAPLRAFADWLEQSAAGKPERAAAPALAQAEVVR